uniref:Uncharacterized protein n=1 Tax=Homalodisca liturata TaxID=320908 RepID=A0A1B6HEZ1_9HEMI
MMASSFERSLLDDSQNGITADMDAVIDHVTSALSFCTQEYKDKAKENSMLLEKLGLSINDLPLDIRRELKEIFSDNEVFNFHSLDSKELVTVNVQHMVDSLWADDELAQIHRLKVQADSVIDSLERTNTSLHRKLEIAKCKTEYLDEKANEIAAQSIVFRGKLEQAEKELQMLHVASQMLEKPKYSLEEIQSLHKELKKVKEDVAFTGTKLDKYNQLSLNEKEAAKQLAKLEKELKNVNNEIKQKL